MFSKFDKFVLIFFVILVSVIFTSAALNGDGTVPLNFPYHPLQYVTINETSMLSVDSDSDGNIDVANKANMVFCDGTYKEVGSCSGLGGTTGGELECVTGKFDENSYNAAVAKGNTYFGELVGTSRGYLGSYVFDDIFSDGRLVEAATPLVYYPQLGCNITNGWVMTGCSSATQGNPLNGDNDETMWGNICNGDQPGDNVVYTRCCQGGGTGGTTPLRTDCAPNEILKWDGDSWECEIDETSGTGGGNGLCLGENIANSSSISVLNASDWHVTPDSADFAAMVDGSEATATKEIITNSGKGVIEINLGREIFGNVKIKAEIAACDVESAAREVPIYITSNGPRADSYSGSFQILSEWQSGSNVPMCNSGSTFLSHSSYFELNVTGDFDGNKLYIQPGLVGGKQIIWMKIKEIEISEFVDCGTGGASSLPDCAAGEYIKRNATDTDWECVGAVTQNQIKTLTNVVYTQNSNPPDIYCNALTPDINNKFSDGLYANNLYCQDKEDGTESTARLTVDLGKAIRGGIVYVDVLFKLTKRGVTGDYFRVTVKSSFDGSEWKEVDYVTADSLSFSERVATGTFSGRYLQIIVYGSGTERGEAYINEIEVYSFAE